MLARIILDVAHIYMPWLFLPLAWWYASFSFRLFVRPSTYNINFCFSYPFNGSLTFNVAHYWYFVVQLLHVKISYSSLTRQPSTCYILCASNIHIHVFIYTYTHLDHPLIGIRVAWAESVIHTMSIWLVVCYKNHNVTNEWETAVDHKCHLSGCVVNDTLCKLYTSYSLL